MGDFDQKILSMLREATATDDFPASFSKDVSQASDPKAQSVDKKWPVEGKVADDDVDVVAEDDMPADDVDDDPKDVVTESDDDDEDDVVDGDGDDEDFDDDEEDDDDDQTFSEMLARLREAPDDPATPEGEIDTNESVKEEQEGEVGKTEPKEEPFQESKKSTKKVKESKGKAKGKKIAEGEVPDAFKKQWAKNSDDKDDDKEDVKEDTDDMPDFLKKKLDKDGDGEPDVKESTLKVAEAADDDDDDDVKKDTDAMFEGQSLPEDFRKKATIVFEAAVKSRAAAARKRYAAEATSKLKEAYDVLKKKSEARIATTEKKLAEQVDQYLTYVAGQWMKENRLAIEAGIRAELAEDFIGGLKKLFVEHYIEVPQSKVDVVKMMGKKLAKMEARVNEQAKENLKLRESMNRYRREEIVRGAAKGLTDTQADKLRKVTEGITFTSKEQFSSAVTTLKESYFPKEKPKGTLVEEDAKKQPATPPASQVAPEPLTEDLSVYVQALNSRKS